MPMYTWSAKVENKEEEIILDVQRVFADYAVPPTMEEACETGMMTADDFETAIWEKLLIHPADKKSGITLQFGKGWSPSGSGGGKGNWGRG